MDLPGGSLRTRFVKSDVLVSSVVRDRQPQMAVRRHRIKDVSAQHEVTSAARWNTAYADGDQGKSWYQTHATTSVELITQVSTVTDAVVDVGGGASTLVDDLLTAGYRDLTVLDIAATGMDIARKRLGASAAQVNWRVDDLLSWQPERSYAVWHDRAVLHFLTDRDARERYRRALLAATYPGSVAVIGVFGPDGPSQCSGLDVHRYGPTEMAELLEPAFAVAASFSRDHTSPSLATQQFQWTTARRR